MSFPPIYFNSLVPKRLCDCVTRTTERWSQAHLMGWWRKKSSSEKPTTAEWREMFNNHEKSFHFQLKVFLFACMWDLHKFFLRSNVSGFCVVSKKIGNSVSEAEKLCFVIKIEVSLPDRAAHPSLSVQIELALIRMERLWRQKQCSARSCSSFIILALHWGGKQETRF